MKSRNIVMTIVAVIVFVTLNSAFYAIDETEQAIILQFGKPIGESIQEAGLHFKLPFIQDIKRFDKRVLEWDGDPNQVPTSDKKYIWVNTFGRWRIVDPLKFYQSVRGDERAAQSRLDDLIDSATRNFLSENLLIEAVRNTNRVLRTTIEDQESSFSAEVRTVEIEKGREEITELIQNAAAEAMPEFGIELLDMQIKRINYIDEVREKVYERMISERKRVAEKFRSEGEGRRAEINGEREKELQRITSEAYRTAQEIEGKADAEATRIYASSFNRDPDFYSFIQTLESYKQTMKKNTTVIINTDSEYLKYLKNIR